MPTAEQAYELADIHRGTGWNENPWYAWMEWAAEKEYPKAILEVNLEKKRREEDKEEHQRKQQEEEQKRAERFRREEERKREVERQQAEEHRKAELRRVKQEEYRREFESRKNNAMHMETQFEKTEVVTKDKKERLNEKIKEILETILDAIIDSTLLKIVIVVGLIIGLFFIAGGGNISKGADELGHSMSAPLAFGLLAFFVWLFSKFFW